MPDGLTAIVCDDAPGYRALMRALLTEAGVRVVAEAESWAEAEPLAADADILFLDLWMPELDVAALGRMRDLAPHATLVVVTALPVNDAAQRVAGIRVDLLRAKSTPPGEIVEQAVARARSRVRRFERCDRQAPTDG
jgi:DNA-binding NarL/FixJ family response regulator